VAAGRATPIGAGESRLQEFLAPVAAYRRSANAQASLSSAANAAHESSLLRTPEALAMSVDHLLGCVLPRLDPGLHFDTKYSYLSDRLRQCKKEITMQSMGHDDRASLLTARLLERMVRFYIVSLFVNFGATPDPQRSFDPAMAQDRLNDCMQSLLECCQFNQPRPTRSVRISCYDSTPSCCWFLPISLLAALAAPVPVLV